MSVQENDQLSRDVGTLGRLLGDVLREIEGDAGFDLVESIRAETKALRADGERLGTFGAAGAALLTRIGALSADEMRLLTRAFTAYFHLVNSIEERHRLRVLRQRQRAAPDEPRTDSIEHVIAAAARDGDTINAVLYYDWGTGGGWGDTATGRRYPRVKTHLKMTIAPASSARVLSVSRATGEGTEIVGAPVPVKAGATSVETDLVLDSTTGYSVTVK